MLVDTHCHLYKEYYDSLTDVLKEASLNQVSKFIVAGCDQKSNEEVLELLKSQDSIYGCLGIHPESVTTYQDKDLLFLEEHLKDVRVVAVGEIGLDYHFDKEHKEQQKELFEKQLVLAEKYSLPVVVHSRDATKDTIEILKKFPKVKGVIHSFSGSLEVAEIYIKMGYKLGINGVATFKNSHLKEILPTIFPDIVLETDSPYLTPHPYRGNKNSPKNILLIADFICEYLNISKNQLEKVTNENVRAVFDILV